MKIFKRVLRVCGAGKGTLCEERYKTLTFREEERKMEEKKVELPEFAGDVAKVRGYAETLKIDPEGKSDSELVVAVLDEIIKRYDAGHEALGREDFNEYKRQNMEMLQWYQDHKDFGPPSTSEECETTMAGVLDVIEEWVGAQHEDGKQVMFIGGFVVFDPEADFDVIDGRTIAYGYREALMASIEGMTKMVKEAKDDFVNV